jgi:predicted regulator of Ras-like GTPase activity (Roadblock/LC7/MglB family)
MNCMATIRDLVGAIRKREGVEAVVVLGRDGLVIDSQTSDELTPDDLAAHVPSVLTAADELGGAAERGALATAVLEYERGLAIVSVLSGDALLLVLARPNPNLGQLLFELRRNREHIAALV